MSELTTCNFCNLEEMKARARKMDCRIVLVPAEGGLGGTEVFRVSKGKSLDARSPDKGGTQWIAWFMELTEKCAC